MFLAGAFRRSGEFDRGVCVGKVFAWATPKGLRTSVRKRARLRRTMKQEDTDASNRASSCERSSIKASEQSEKQSASPQKRTNGPRLVTHFPKAEDAALATFEEIDDCVYQTSRMGRTRGQDDPSCECTMALGPALACTDESGCINRLTQVECLRDVCRCGVHCANQRFQQHAYAKVDIVKTPDKGYGLRAQTDLGRDEFVYEYIGEVINHDTFMRRMAQYKTEHIEHFYFMMLQRDEYIDATKRGGRSRFINHSCSPNCYVSKWHVGRHVRMGIFAKRRILAGEELTFNYNVDRYGNDPQPCYCGEPNCVGTLGGRTQTDVVTMDDRFITALGIADQVAQLRASLPRGKRSKILDEDFSPTLHAIAEDECARVMTVMRDATANRKMVQMLLTRVRLTDDISVHKMLVKMHGFVVMAGVLDEWVDDWELVHLALQCLEKWPLLARDKVVDSGVGLQVQQILEACKRESESEKKFEGHLSKVAMLAQYLVHKWEQLPTTFRIARKDGTEEDEDGGAWAARRRAQASSSTQASHDDTTSSAVSEELRRSLLAYRDADKNVPTAPDVPRSSRMKEEPRKKDEAQMHKNSLPSIEDIIRRANEDSEAQQKRLLQQQELELEEQKREKERKEREKKKRRAKQHDEMRGGQDMASTSASKRASPSSSESHIVHKDKRARSASAHEDTDIETLERHLRKLVGALVIKQMSKVRDQLDRERFKRHAKEVSTKSVSPLTLLLQLTQVLCDKEKRNPKTWPPRLPEGQPGLRELSEDKRKKMKIFAHEYIKKLLRHKSKAHMSADTSADLSTQPDTSVDASIDLGSPSSSTTKKPSSPSLSPPSDT